MMLHIGNMPARGLMQMPQKFILLNTLTRVDSQNMDMQRDTKDFAAPAQRQRPERWTRTTES